MRMALYGYAKTYILGCQMEVFASQLFMITYILIPHLLIVEVLVLFIIALIDVTTVKEV